MTLSGRQIQQNEDQFGTRINIHRKPPDDKPDPTNTKAGPGSINPGPAVLHTTRS